MDQCAISQIIYHNLILIVLLQTISQKEDILLNNKISLYKKEPLSSDQQEKLLLHLDNELNEVEKNEIAALIKSSKSVSEEWDMVKYAKFFPESTIVYEDKKSLYRNEKERLVFLPWRKLMTAAILVGVGLWGGLVYLNSSSNISNQVIPNSENKLIVAEIKKNSSESANQIKKLPIEQSSKRANIRPSNFVDKVSNFNGSSVDKISLTSEERNTNEISNLNISRNELVGLINKVNNRDENNSEQNNGIVLEKKLLERLKELNLKQADNQLINEQSLLTVYSNVVDSSENNNQFFLIGEEKIKKIMSGGFFVKVKKSLERRSNNQNLNNTIKVANFEITVR
jgi:hypothetical protein